MQVVCEEILEVFDELIPYQYTEEDRRAGYFLGRDRRGNILWVPIMTLSIGVVTNEHRVFTHTARVSELATEMKTYAKKQPGSVYAVDRRADGAGFYGRSLAPGRTQGFDGTMNIRCPNCQTAFRVDPARRSRLRACARAAPAAARPSP
jgi:hypothetical protein